MKYKVANLEGALLDAAVAKAEDVILVWENFERLDYSAINELDGRNYRPSVDWRIGGKIIERERIASFNSKGIWFAGYEIGSIAEQYYDPESVPVLFDGSEASGPTLLVAAMRAYVSSRFGEEVELP